MARTFETQFTKDVRTNAREGLRQLERACERLGVHEVLFPKQALRCYVATEKKEIAVYGFYRKELLDILIDGRKPSERKFMTLVHELAHHVHWTRWQYHQQDYSTVEGRAIVEAFANGVEQSISASILRWTPRFSFTAKDKALLQSIDGVYEAMLVTVRLIKLAMAQKLTDDLVQGALDDTLPASMYARATVVPVTAKTKVHTAHVEHGTIAASTI